MAIVSWCPRGDRTWHPFLQTRYRVTAIGTIIQARNLTRKHQAREFTLLAPTDFSLLAGSQLAITGPSGSGKSVFLRTLALLDMPSAGQVFWNGHQVQGGMIPQYRSRVCYVSQKAAVTDGSVEDNLRFPFALKHHRHRNFSKEFASCLLEKAGKDGSFLSKRAAELSGGELQVMALVRILQLEPEVMLLDEPTSALDPASATAVENLVMDWFALKSASRAYIWVSHDPAQVVRVAARYLKMDKGVLAQWSPI